MTISFLPRVLSHLAASSVAALLLAACGGGGDGTTEGTTVGGGSSSPTNFVAQMEILGVAPDSLIATSSGIYGLQQGTPDKVVKWQRTPGAVGWLSYTLPTTVSNFAPGKLFSDEGITVHYAGFRSSDVKQVYGYLGRAEIDDVGINKLVAPGGTSLRQWALTLSGDAWIKSTGGGLGSNARSTFTQVARTGYSSLGEIAAAADADNTLFAGSGSTLVRITATGTVSTWTLPATVNSIVATLGTVWVGAGSTVYRINGNGNLETYTVVTDTLGLHAPIFCISGLNLYTSNGMVYKGINATTAAPSPKSFLSTTGSVDASSPSFNLFIAARSGMLAGGVRCADNIDEFVFTSIVETNNANAGLKLLKIRPL